jgi:ubiquinone/menaquinone biosynthesis C-methylase UbiE
MLDFSTKVRCQEQLDNGRMPDEDVRKALLDLRRFNRFFGSRGHLLEALKKEVSGRGMTEFSVLDIASGSCDLPVAILDWARQRRLKARVFALEYQHRHLSLFLKELAEYSGLHPFCADVFHAPLRGQTFDFVTCCHFLHHLTEGQTIELLSSMSRWARRAMIVSDLERRSLPYYFFRIFSRLLSTCSVSRNDGLASIRQSFRKQEVERMAGQAGLETFTVEQLWPFRLLLVAEASASVTERAPSTDIHTGERQAACRPL